MPAVTRARAKSNKADQKRAPANSFPSDKQQSQLENLGLSSINVLPGRLIAKEELVGVKLGVLATDVHVASVVDSILVDAYVENKFKPAYSPDQISVLSSYFFQDIQNDDRVARHVGRKNLAKKSIILIPINQRDRFHWKLSTMIGLDQAIRTVRAGGRGLVSVIEHDSLAQGSNIFGDKEEMQAWPKVVKAAITAEGLSGEIDVKFLRAPMIRQKDGWSCGWLMLRLVGIILADGFDFAKKYMREEALNADALTVAGEAVEDGRKRLSAIKSKFQQ